MGRWQALKEAILGVPSKPQEVRPTNVAVLGAVEQSYGIYQVPSFREMVTCFWDDPLLKEAITMFAEQVVATGVFYTSNPKYTLKLPKFDKDGKKIGDQTALEVIKGWADDNNIDIKLLEIAIELKAFGNSLWRLDPILGFIKIPIESIWHAVRISSEIPLQEQYNMQLTPIYSSKIIPWGEFIHFRVGVTGYHAPFGQGVVYSLLAKPTDSKGVVAPSIYDIRLSTRSSLNEGFRKFSFGNELWVFEGMSNEDFEASKIGENIAKMSSTGNRIATNAKGDIKLAVPERTQSYDEFIKQMRDEFFMALADPSLKLGLEQGFTKATSVTASEVYKYKISTMRRTIKEHFEDLFKQILDKLGYDGKEANIEMNFGPDETPEYKIMDLLAAVKLNIVMKNEARHILSTYHKWDITGDIEGGDKPVEAKAINMTGIPTASNRVVSGKESNMPEIVITELPDGLAGYNKDFSKVYIDSLVPKEMIPFIVYHETYEYLQRTLGKNYEEAHKLATEEEKKIVIKSGINWDGYNKTYLSLLPTIKARNSKGPEDLYIDKGPISIIIEG
jgi:hypothetical protein